MSQRSVGVCPGACAHFGCPAQMSCPEELSALPDEDLLEFLMKDDAPCLEIPGEENGLLEDWGLPELGVSSLGGITVGLGFRRFGSLLSKIFFSTAPGQGDG